MSDRQDTWDRSKDVDLDALRQAEEQLIRERSNPNNYGYGGPRPTVDEIWERAQQIRNPYPC